MTIASNKRFRTENESTSERLLFVGQTGFGPRPSREWATTVINNIRVRSHKGLADATMTVSETVRAPPTGRVTRANGQRRLSTFELVCRTHARPHTRCLLFCTVYRREGWREGGGEITNPTAHNRVSNARRQDVSRTSVRSRAVSRRKFVRTRSFLNESITTGTEKRVGVETNPRTAPSDFFARCFFADICRPKCGKASTAKKYAKPSLMCQYNY